MTSEPRISPLVEDANNRFPGGWSLTTTYSTAGTPVDGIIDLGEGWTLTCFDPNPVRVATPPAVPPTFEQQPVTVTLGTSGDTVTLMTTQSGGFTLNGEAFRSGGRVTSGNGGVYILTLSEGTWTATFDEHEIRVPLGASEETVTIRQAEDGTYWLGEMAVRSGETVHVASNGNEYVLRITTAPSGAIRWMATYRTQMIPVKLGLSGDTVTLEKAEDGSYWLNKMVVTSGETTTKAGNGNIYTLMLLEDGTWRAELFGSTSEKVPPSGSTTAAIVTLTNLTPGQVMAPAIVIVHGEDSRPVFTPGERASPALVMFAEEDQSAMLLGEAGQDPHVTDARVVLGTGPNGTIGPGGSASLSITVRPGLDQITVVASLTSTNDGFVGANGIRIPVSDEVEEFLVAWDAGSEVNDEDCSHVPGPPCGKHVKGVREGAAIVVHSGIHGHGDLAPKTFDWDYPAAKVSIELSGSR